MPLVRPGAARWSPSGPAVFASEAPSDADSASKFTSSILESYLEAFQEFQGGDADGCGGDGYDEALARVQEALLGDADGAASCLICLEDVGPEAPVWSCAGTPLDPGCFVTLHLGCAQAWARQQLTAGAGAPGDVAAEAAPRPAAWACPKCRRESPAVPSTYRCFCGKEADPPFNPWNAPHSCGEACGAENPACGHPCMLLCHPGPHPPCPRVLPATCFCGKETAARRCGRREWGCGKMCGRALAGCGHPCPALCHPGDCPACIRLVTAACRCGAESKELRCGARGAFRCERVCGRALSCGRHACERRCCDGGCVGEGCPRAAAAAACPCGKVTQKVECGAAVPPCGQTCGKALPCGRHRCQERCHVGSCPQTCRAPVEKACRCGAATKTVQCWEDFRCERRCGRARACGRHACRRRCCDGGPACGECPELCGRRLRCGNHKCQAPCHPGPCAPCPLVSRIRCACGQTAYAAPCGREAAAKPPRCALPCSVPATCRHGAAVPPHRCHFGPCPGRADLPPCPLPCGAALPCGHPCGAAACHDPPPPTVPPHDPPPPPVAPGEDSVSKKRLEALAAPPTAEAPAAEAAALAAAGGGRAACPPCAVPVAVGCLGGHTTRETSCAAAAPFACEAPCGRALACGNHVCAQACHDPGTAPCAPCARRCERARPAGCAHRCPRGDGACHPGDCGDCGEEVTRACFCGKTSVGFRCWEVTAPGGPPAAALRCGKACCRALPRCPHACEAPCHQGPCPAAAPGGRCEADVSVRCGCKRLKKKVRCFEAAALLRAAGQGDGAYDATTSLRLLPCDAECEAAAAAAAQEAAAAAAKAAAKASAAVQRPASLSRKQVLQQERAAEAERRERERQERAAAKARTRRIQTVARAVALAVLVAALYLGVTGVLRLLTSVDQAAQSAWGSGVGGR